MKILKQIITRVLELKDSPSAELDALVWRFVCYSPKMPLRPHEIKLLEQAKKFNFIVPDRYFQQGDLNCNGFIWGDGRHKILITHGWGSKAADFSDLINALLTLHDVQIIAFDAPGNGSSDGELSNLLMFVDAITAVIEQHGAPDALIGHSLGAMANVIAVNQLNLKPLLLVSLAPLIRLKENFEVRLNSIDIPETVQQKFFETFEARYGMKPEAFTMDSVYSEEQQRNHLLVYDRNDQISPAIYVEEFLSGHPGIKSLRCNGTGHDRIIKSEEMIAELFLKIKSVV